MKRPALSTTTNAGIPQSPVTTNGPDENDGEFDVTADEEAVVVTGPNTHIFAEQSDEARVTSYHKPQSHANTGSKKRTVELGSALDGFINAVTHYIKCQRYVPNLYFGNDQACKSNILFNNHCTILIIST